MIHARLLGIGANRAPSVNIQSSHSKAKSSKTALSSGMISRVGSVLVRLSMSDEIDGEHDSCW